MSVRTEKVASLVKEEISTIFQRNFAMEEYGFMTVTEVRMSPDLKNARVYVSIFGDESQKKKTLERLEGQKSFIRANLGHSLRLKFTPTILFQLDDSLDKAMKIEAIINRIHDEEKGKED